MILLYLTKKIDKNLSSNTNSSYSLNRLLLLIYLFATIAGFAALLCFETSIQPHESLTNVVFITFKKNNIFLLLAMYPIIVLAFLLSLLIAGWPRIIVVSFILVYFLGFYIFKKNRIIWAFYMDLALCALGAVALYGMCGV